jgi:hemerythrin superfamily protein
MATSRNAKKGRRSSGTRSRSTRSAGPRSTSSRASGARGAKKRNGGGRDDAIALLKADHREVEQWFSEFESARSQDRKRDLAERICASLRAHTTIEEEIFYPAFLEATDDTEVHHEAEVEHAGAKHLIEEIEAAGPDDDHFEARVTVLREMIRHHVKEEEQRGGMFSKAQSSSMDLQALGRQLGERKLELMGDSVGGIDEEDTMPEEARSRRGGRELRTRSG